LHFFKKKYLIDLEFVKDEVRRIVAKQKPGSYYDLSPFKGKIEEMLDSISEFNPDWNRFPVVFRIVSVAKNSAKDFDHTFRSDEKTGSGVGVYTYQENIVLPDTNHDFDLVARMLNHMREQKKFKRVDVPLFIQPDELILAYKDGRFELSGGIIQAQIVIIFQRGSIMNIGFVFGRNYVILGK
jgi:hypothetical protein